MAISSEEKQKRVSPGRVSFLDGQGELPMLEVSSAGSIAEIYLHGAHVTGFRRKGEPQVLFMSQCSRFAEGQPIRGGVPVVFPWFGSREGFGQHGFARIKNWELKEFAPTPDGSVSVRFRLPYCPEGSSLPPFAAEYIVTVNEGLVLQLVVTNESEEESFTFENCLHSYFEVGDINEISIKGLKGAQYLDKVENFTKKTESEEALRIGSEVDRIYLDVIEPVEIVDARLGRRIRIEKRGSLSTVVWNPWKARAHQMPDFGDDEYQRMVCVEAGNVASNQITLPPGGSTTLKVKITTERL
jgi:glucose-6-phosphate 1-epimerase